eukprot:CAMPEP_0180417354 /NCGR_PEP_ID=MMETSP1036_2-20121128/986_1 /TAXON_ID=632150 /ORGANISM="Azadinium spinosum, Strain 3D9" /LENGTH=98 /DNA_ID=CAMNT_0022422373 /DNA_START=376 /DNA_END=669 /DNA_ORIENTATION=+
MAWACAKLIWLNNPLMTAISAAAITKLTEFQVQEISNTSWAFATLGIQAGTQGTYASGVLRAVVVVRCSEFGLQDLSNTVWSLASLRKKDDPLLHAIA